MPAVSTICVHATRVAAGVAVPLRDGVDQSLAAAEVAAHVLLLLLLGTLPKLNPLPTPSTPHFLQ